MNDQNQSYGVGSRTKQVETRLRRPFRAGRGLMAMTVAAAALAETAGHAQSISLRSSPVRVTVADTATTASVLTNYVSTSGTLTENVTLLGLPASYASASFGTNTAAISASFGTLLTINSANVPDGIYPLDLNASGTVTGDLYLTFQSGRMWTGTTNVTTAWSSPASWIGGVPPGPANDVLFTQIGAQTNSTIAGLFSSNSVVDQNFTVASLRFSQTNGGASYHTININPNVTLALTGSNGLSMLQDFTGLGSGMNALFAGQSGTLEVSNSAANITMLEDDQTTHTLDMSRLGTLVAQINRLAPGDYTLYPNWTNIIAEGYSSSTAPFVYPNKFYPKLYLARTNFIQALYVDPNNYTNASSRLYAIETVNNPVSASSSSAAPTFYLGISNAINADGICFSGFGGTTMGVGFNPFLYINTNVPSPGVTNYTTNSFVATFRNTDGVGRMSVLSLGDMAGSYTNAQGNTKCNVNFGSLNGYVDILVDRLYMGRDRAQVFNGSGDDSQTTFSIGSGIVNANTVVIGDQENGTQPFQNYCYGTMWVSNSAVLRVNNSLQLGYTTAPYNDPSLPGDTYGALVIGPGGTVIANTIGVGGLTKNSGKVGNTGGSQLNYLSLTNGATLVVSNTIGDASAVTSPSATAGISPGMLGNFNMVNSELVLNVNGTNQGAYLFTSAMTYPASVSNYLVIASIKNLTVPSVGSTNIPLIWIQGASPNAGGYAAAFTKIIVPSGYQGALVQDATNSQVLDLVLSAHTPRNLKWQGYLGADWDTSTQNWLDLTTGLHTNYDNGDFTTFDDSTTVTNINISSAVTLIPNNILVTNNNNYYTFGGGGGLSGGASITKAGVGVLEIDVPVSLGVVVNGGTLTGNSAGAVGNVSVATGAVLNYSGTVNGNVTCAGLGINNGTINGPLTVATGGLFTNLNTLDATFATQTGGSLVNAGSITFPLGYTSTVATNSMFINEGSISGDVISVTGTFEDLGGSDSITLTSLSVVAGGTLIPGGPGVGTTTIEQDGSGNFPGGVLLSQGATLILQVNPGGSPVNSQLSCAHLSFGGSTSQQNQNGCTLLLTNVGTPFGLGQSFSFFPNSEGGNVPFSTGTSTNTFPVIVPAQPGPGLAWDLSQFWASGVINVISAQSGPSLSSSFALSGTNAIGQFSWPSQYLGYRLESQANMLSVGLSTNWTGVPGSTTNLSMTITNTLSPTNCVFYRLVFP